jgi:hypothetical protein
LPAAREALADWPYAPGRWPTGGAGEAWWYWIGAAGARACSGNDGIDVESNRMLASRWRTSTALAGRPSGVLASICEIRASRSAGASGAYDRSGSGVAY